MYGISSFNRPEDICALVDLILPRKKERRSTKARLDKMRLVRAGHRLINLTSYGESELVSSLQPKIIRRHCPVFRPHLTKRQRVHARLLQEAKEIASDAILVRVSIIHRLAITHPNTMNRLLRKIECTCRLQQDFFWIADLVEHTCSFLSEDELNSLRMTSKQMNQVIQESEWCPIDLMSFPRYQDRVSRVCSHLRNVDNLLDYSLYREVNELRNHNSRYNLMTRHDKDLLTSGIIRYLKRWDFDMSSYQPAGSQNSYGSYPRGLVGLSGSIGPIWSGVPIGPKRLYPRRLSRIIDTCITLIKLPRREYPHHIFHRIKERRVRIQRQFCRRM